MGTSEMDPLASSSSSQPSKPQRVLACVRCQRRKIKCERRFPCAHCKKSGVQCVPAIFTPCVQRKRRFPERELLGRLRKYEDLLRQNNIQFEPLHKDVEPSESGAPCPSPSSTSVKSEKIYEAKYVLLRRHPKAKLILLEAYCMP